MTEKLLLTGATGFIGSELVKKLTDYEVTCLIPSAEVGQKQFPENVAIEFADLTNLHSVKEIISRIKPNIVVHLAAATPVRFSYEYPEIYQDLDYLATINLAIASSKLTDFKKFVFASTMETYGWQVTHTPFIESTPLNPASPYAVAKVAADNYIRMMGLSLNFPHVVMRCCNTFGRKNEKDYFMEHVITSYLSNKVPQVGEPDSIRDYMYVDDHMNAYVKAIEYDINVSEIRENLEADINYYSFNFGNSFEFTNGEHVQKIAKILSCEPKFEKAYPKNYPYRPINEPYLVLNASKAKGKLGWKPQVTLEEGYKKTIAYWKEKLV